jgi:hypothetical protein
MAIFVADGSRPKVFDAHFLNCKNVKYLAK